MGENRRASHRPRAEATRARREAILDAALHVFLEKGLLDATIQDILERSGASIGSLYHHFGGKEGVAAALLVDGYEDINASLIAVIESNPTSADGLADTVRAYLDWFAEHPRWGSFLFRAVDMGLETGAGPELRALEEQFGERYLRWLQPHIEAREVRRLPRELYVALIIGPSRDFLRRWLPHPERQRFEVAREALATAARNVLLL